MDTTFSIAAGAVIAILVSLIFYAAKPVWIFLIPIGLLLFLPTFILKDVKPYWLTLFIFSLQIPIAKNLIDKHRILDYFEIDYLQYVLVPEIRMSDLPLFILFALWAYKIYTKKTGIYFPKISYLILGYIGWSILSLFKAPYIYLGVIEILRQCKFFLIYLYAANNIDSKKTVKLILSVLLISIVLQGTVTVMRYQFQFYEPLIGRTLGGEIEEWDETIESMITVDPSKDSDTKSSFGILSFTGTRNYLLLTIPIALLLCTKNNLFSRRWIFFLIFMLGSSALYLTFSRSALIGLIAEIILCYYFGLRRGYISKKMGLALLFLMIIVSFVMVPKIYSHINRKIENITLRFDQYDTAFSMVRSNPILGVGINNSTGEQKNYDKSDHTLYELTRNPYQPTHSFFILTIVEVGIIGFLLYITFFILICLKALKLSTSSLNPKVGFFSTIFLISILGLAVGVLTNPFVEDQNITLLWLYFGIIVAFARKEEKENALNQG